MKYFSLFILAWICSCSSTKLITTPDGIVTSDLEMHEKTIYILNRSFEKVEGRSLERSGISRNGTPASPKIPNHWMSADEFDFTSAIEGSWARYYDKSIYPKHGKYYACLDLTPEGKGEMSQQLSKPLENGGKYQFSLHTCSFQLNPTLATEYALKFDPCHLKIWGSFDGYEKIELLNVVPAIANHNWKESVMAFQPKENYTHIVFEIVSDTDSKSSYGNILIDDISNIEKK